MTPAYTDREGRSLRKGDVIAAVTRAGEKEQPCMPENEVWANAGL